MTERPDRRNPKIRRVPLTTLVDICVDEGDRSAFQGELSNVSGRGMQVRGSHLPDLGESLVCRFEHGGREVLVEGRVAWRSEAEDGGEFGVQFTALDGDSAEILTELGRSKADVPRSGRALDAADDEDAPLSSAKVLTRGNRVKLHIDGLGAPMRAHVQDGGDRKLRVGSNLEFLRVGRSIELEAVDGELRRGATIDGVNVVLNPNTSVPELVVHLRYEGISPTPPPARTQASEEGPDYEDALDGDDEGDDAAGARSLGLGFEMPAFLEGRFGRALSRAKDSAGVVGSSLVSAAKVVGQGAQRVASEKIGHLREARQSRAAAPRRKTSPSGERASERLASDAGRSLRPQTLRTSRPPLRSNARLAELGLSSRPRAEQARSSRTPEPVIGQTPTSRALARKVIYLSAGVIVVGSALILRSVLGSPGGGDSAAAPLASASAAAPEAPVPEVALSKAVPVAPAALAAPTHPDGIVAEVPLFGERRITEEAPAVAAAAPASEAELERLAAAAAVPDQAFRDDAEPTEEAVTSWGRGKLHLPTVHRIRLDGPGARLEGSVAGEGFSVVIPGRKAMENGSGIQKRDSRIAKISTTQVGGGVKIGFSFRGPVPAYRVRLRKDFVEFFISAPEDGVASL